MSKTTEYVINVMNNEYVINVMNKRVAEKRQAALKAVRLARECAKYYLGTGDFKACAHYIDECRRIRERNGIPIKDTL